ncbi:triose-phosphate isomerase [Desulfococcaceae bacterium HSG9]|nr:triose-phosphate isomerase [Desulfococcaceae bacterium HSG9]
MGNISRYADSLLRQRQTRFRPSIMALDNLDGVLVGGASLNAENFSQIVVA